MRFNSLLFGTAGIPLSTKERNTVNGVAHVRKLDLDAMELEFVRMVHLNEKTAIPVKEEANNNKVVLTCHGQYYINLNSQEKAKIEASKKRVFQAAKISHLAGAVSMTFHAAYYMNEPSEKVYPKVKLVLSAVVRQLKDEGCSLWIRPETTGKGSQFGTVDEIIKLSQEIEQVMPCVDFAHLFARSVGKDNSLAYFKGVLESIEKGLGKEALQTMHIHISGIKYGQKGERNHLNLKEETNEFNYKDVLKALKEFKARGVVICESPNIEQDALLMKNIFGSLG